MMFAISLASLSLMVAFTEAADVLSNSVVTNMYQGCGVTTGCLGLTDTFKWSIGDSVRCIENQNCHALAVFNSTRVPDEDEVDFTFFVRIGNVTNQYVALGISDNDKMGSDTVVVCKSSDTEPFIQAVPYFNKEKTPTVLESPPEGSYIHPMAIYDGEHLVCGYSRKLDTTVEGTAFNLSSNQYHLLFATGQLNMADVNLPIRTHTKKVALPKLNLTVPWSPETPVDEFYENCWMDRGCFGCTKDFKCYTQDGCFRERNCIYVINYERITDDSVRFSFLYDVGSDEDVTTPQWVGIGISPDRIMVLFEF
ncbi:unnamed protein product [Notodromas monacha]|uniref:DOMON domain-containing protein n=1 Tax=Notodromas monacha TaxID=399045 RepID=A0A7R9BW40_9CRUS|nr:unnamed protein product [Notodromas monacha]CAG0921655.1 unnamed protein product [Notodromas monacha]